VQRSLGNQALILRDHGELAAARHHVEILNHDLDNSRAAFENIRRQRDELIRENEQTKKAQSAHTTELEQLKSALAAEKLRAEDAEQKVWAVLQEKSRSEETFRQTLHDITEKAKQQEQENLRLADELVLEGMGISFYETEENLRLADELTAEQSRRIDAEHKFEAFRLEMLKKETTLVAENENLQGYCDALQQKFDMLMESFDAERQKITSLLKEAEIAAEEEKCRRLIMEDTLSAMGSARDEELRALQSAFSDIREKLGAKEEELCVAVRGLENLEKELGAKEEELGIAAQGLENLEKELAAKEEKLGSVVHELETVKNSLENLEKELDAAVQVRKQSEDFAQSVLRECDQLKGELGNEQQLRHRAEDALNHMVQIKEQIEQKLHTVTNKKAQEKNRGLAKIQTLKDELKTLHGRQKSLEALLSTAERERLEKEATLQKLSGELNQTMAKLEAESEKWRATEKELMVIREEVIRNKPETAPTTAEELPVDQHAVVVRGIDLLAGIDSGKQPVVVQENPTVDQDLQYNELLVPPNPEARKVPAEKVHSLQNLSDERRNPVIPVLPDEEPAPGGKAQDTPYVEGPALMTEKGIPVETGGREKTHFVKREGEYISLKLPGDKEQISYKIEDRELLQKSLGNQALIHRDRGELDRAMELLMEQEQICRELGNKDGLQRSLGNQALIYRDRGELDRAMELHREKEEICRELGNKKGIVISLANQAGILLYEKQDPSAALPLVEEAYQIAVSSGFESLVNQLRVHLGKVQKMSGFLQNQK